MKIKYNIYNINNNFLLLLLLYFNINNNNIYCQNTITVNNDYDSSSLDKDVNNGNLSEMNTDDSDDDGNSTTVSDNEGNSTEVRKGDNLFKGNIDSNSDNLSEKDTDDSDGEGKDIQLKDHQDNEDNKNFDNIENNNLKKEEEKPVEKRAQSKPMIMLRKGIIGVFFIAIVSFIIYLKKRNDKKEGTTSGQEGLLGGQSNVVEEIIGQRRFKVEKELENEGGVSGEFEDGVLGLNKNILNQNTSNQKTILKSIEHPKQKVLKKNEIIIKNLSETEEQLNNSLQAGIELNKNLFNLYSFIQYLNNKFETIQTEILESMKKKDIGTKKEFNVIKINKILEQNQYAIPDTIDEINTTKINVIEFEELYSKDSIDDNMQQIKIKKDEIEKQIQQHNNNIIKNILKLQSEQEYQDKIIYNFIKDTFNIKYYDELDLQLLGYLMGQAQKEVDIQNEDNRIPLIEFSSDEKTLFFNNQKNYNCIFKNESDIQRFVNLITQESSKQEKQLSTDELNQIIAGVRKENNIPIIKDALMNKESDIRKYIDKYDLLYNAFNSIVDDTKPKLYEKMQKDDELTKGTYYSIPINDTTINVYIENIVTSALGKKIFFSFYEKLSNGLIIKKIFKIDNDIFENRFIYDKYFENNNLIIPNKDINIVNKQISWFYYNINKSNEIIDIKTNYIWLYINSKTIEYKRIQIKATDKSPESQSE